MQTNARVLKALKRTHTFYKIINKLFKDASNSWERSRIGIIRSKIIN